MLCLLIAIVGCRTAQTPKAETVDSDPEIVRTQTLEEACKKDSKSCDTLAFRYIEGIGADVDLPRAAGLFERACKDGLASACYHLAHLYETGSGVEQSNQQAADLYRVACTAEVPRACNNLAVLLARIDESKGEAETLQAKGCEQGDGLACFNLGFKAEKKLEWQDANAFYGRGCELGNGRSCYYQGVLFRYGRGTEVDLERGAELYIKGCQLGSLLSCNNAGFLFQSGEGVKKDIVEASKYYLKACSGGLPRGCTNYAVLVEKGVASKVTPFEAYTASCKAGDGKGCSRLGVLHLGGKHGAKKDMDAAKISFIRSCELGYGSGCCNVGVMYEDAMGMKADYDSAKKFYELACRAKEYKGCHNLGVMWANGVGSKKKDLGKAADHFMVACENGYTESCFFLGREWMKQAEKRDLGIPLVQKACKAGHSEGCKLLEK